MVKAGLIGGSRPGAGRPRKSVSGSQKRKRASTVVAEAARNNADLIASTFTDAMNDPAASGRQRMMAGKALVGIELQEEERRREDERDGRDLPPMPQDRDALVEALAAKIAGNPILAAELGAVLTRAGQLAGDSSRTPSLDRETAGKRP